MQNKKFKLAALLSTVLLALSLLVTSIGAVAPNGGAFNSSASSSAKFVGSKNSSSEISYTSNVNSKSLNSVANASSSQNSSLLAASSQASSSIASTANSLESTPVVDNGSMVDQDSNSEGFIGKYQVTTHTTYGNNVVNLPEGNGIYPHFDVNDDIGKCYCYDWQVPAPDQPGTNYNGYKFYDGMKVATNKQKAAEVAAALMAGYHLNKTTNQWEMSPALQQEAQDGYNTLEKDYKDNDYTPDANDTVGNLIYDQSGDKLQLSPNYSLKDYERDVTQSVIWKISGATDSTADLANKTKLGRDLYAYAMSHPLDQQTAYSKDLKAVSQGTQLSVNHPLTIDPTTLKSQTFQITGYNGEVAVKDLDPNVQIIDSTTNQPTSVLLSGHTYYLQAKTLNTANKKNYFNLDYENLAESHYFSVEDLNATSLEANNKYQNMVNLATNSLNLAVNYVYRQSSSSLAKSSSSSKVSSSSVKSSSLVKSSSSKKSSSIVSSSKLSSSKKSSTVVSSSKLSSSKKSSSIASSSKLSSSEKSSTVVSSSKVSSSKKSSTVASSSKVSSSKKSSTVVSSSKLNSSKKSSSIVLSSKSSSSKKSSTVVSSSKLSSSKKSSSIASSSKLSSSSKSSSAVLSSKVSSSKKSSTVVLSSKVSSSKKNSAVVSSSEQGTQASSLSSQASQKKQGVVTGSSSQKVAQGSKHGKGEGEGHGMPQTGEAETALAFVGVVLLATAGAIELRKNK